MNKQTMRCTIHDIKFQTVPMDMGEKPVECPMCLRKEMDILQGKYEDVVHHRGLLLDAIDLKLTIKVDEANSL